jgi:hypothetical protein
MLCEYKNLIDIRIDAVRDRDVNQPIFAAQRNGRLRALLRERKQTCSGTSAQDYREQFAARDHKFLPSFRELGMP